MQVLGIDFTSRPKRGKPITCARCTFRGDLLHFDDMETWEDFDGFEAALRRPGPWIAGMDFPFGQTRRLVENLGWPAAWSAYVRLVERLGREGFRATLEAYKAPRAKGDKEHRRRLDEIAGSVSPQKLYGVPVALMFFEGAPRLLSSGATVVHHHRGDPDRIAIEAYPGVLARALIGRRPYKADERQKQTAARLAARCEMLDLILGDGLGESYGFQVVADRSLADDATGDRLDALLCAIQAAWAWTRRGQNYGAPADVDPVEGWIADPALSDAGALAAGGIDR